MFELPEERKKVKEIFQNIYQKDKALVPLFKNALKNNDPIGLYVATQSNDDILWLFDKKEIGLMLGGANALNSIIDQLLPTEEDKKNEIVMVILKKVGPIYSIRLSKSILEEVFI